MKLKKVISGGQTGADQAGLIAAKIAGLETGGYMPARYRTEIGSNPKFAKEYNLIEHSSSDYKPRTFENVYNSDGTIRFARDFLSSGEKLTLKFIKELSKPYLDIFIDDPIDIYQTYDWIDRNGLVTLNIAGNAESRAPGIGEFVKNYLVRVFSLGEK